MLRLLLMLVTVSLLCACATTKHHHTRDHSEPQALLFDIDEAALKPASIAYLNELSEFLECHEEYKVVIEGYTDSTASNDYNLKLSQRRAQVVQSYLVAKGLSAQRTTIAAYGEERPAEDNKSTEGRKQNRRVVVSPIKQEEVVIHIPVSGPPRFNYTSTDPKIASTNHNSGIRATHR